MATPRARLGCRLIEMGDGAYAQRPTEANAVVDYDDAWPERFRAIAGYVAPALAGTSYVVAHVGSTAVPGLAAKPIIDVHIAVPKSRDIMDAVQRLETIGYHHEGDGDIPGREVLKAPTAAGYHHMYVVEIGTKPSTLVTTCRSGGQFTRVLALTAGI